MAIDISSVRAWWEKNPCNTNDILTKGAAAGTRAWYDNIEAHRYSTEPFIHSTAQFTVHRGKKLLEIGLGAGTDHYQWARAGLHCHGIDLTEASLDIVRTGLGVYGLSSDLRAGNAEKLPYEDASFDLVYSWGVIHHTSDPDAIISEIHRVLRPGGMFIGMMYNRHSIQAVRFWLKYGLFGGKPFHGLGRIIWSHVESEGTKAYTLAELRRMFRQFGECELQPVMTIGERTRMPVFVADCLPARWGWFCTIRSRK